MCWNNIFSQDEETEKNFIKWYFEKEIDLQCLTYRNSECVEVTAEVTAITDRFIEILSKYSIEEIVEIIASSDNLEKVSKDNIPQYSDLNDYTIKWERSENDELDGSLSYLNAKEKEFLVFLLKNRLYEFPQYSDLNDYTIKWERSENDELDGSLSYLNAKEKEFLVFLLKNRLYEFTPIEVGKIIGVTNKTIINRCVKLVNNGLLIPIWW